MVVVDHRTDGVFNNGSEEVQNLEDVKYSHLRSLNGGRNDGHPDDNDEVFFVEAKKTYDTSEYFKFNMRYEFSGDSAHPADLSLANGDDEEFSKALSDRLMKLWANSKNTKGAFEEFNRNVQECVDNLIRIRGVQDKFNFRKMKSFPDDFQELSKVFDFYILEWTNRLMHLKSSYLYEIAMGNDEGSDEIERIVDQSEKIRQKLLSLCD